MKSVFPTVQGLHHFARCCRAALGVTDYHIIRSVHFFDPTGIRLASRNG